MCHRGRKLFQRLSKCPFVTVAAIDGICVGGGAELAIWCDRRVMADEPKTQFGFPEVKLGCFPAGAAPPGHRGLSGCRTPSRWSPAARPSTPARRTNGLASDVTSADRIQAAAIRLIRAEQATKQYLDDRRRWSGPIDINETELGFLGATASGYIQQQTKGHYPAPLAALEVMLGAAGSDIDAACEAEAEGMAALFGSPVNRALINVFFLTDRNKKDTGVDRPNVPTRPIKSVAVHRGRHHGAGHRRRQSEARAARDDDRCRSQGAGRRRAEGLGRSFVQQADKGPDPQRAVKYASLLNATTADAELAACDLVIEAIVENPEVKQQIYARLEPPIARRRDSGLEHIDHSDHAAWPKD